MNVRLIALCIALLMAVPMNAGAEILDRIVARVNNDIVTMYDVRQAAVPFLLQQGQNPSVLDDPSRRDKILEEALEELIDRKLLVQEAEKIDYKVSDAELDQWLEFTRSQQKMSEEQFRKVIEGYGMKYETYREMVRQNLLKVRMIKIKVGSQITITDADVEAKYKEKFGSTPEKARYLTIRHILIRPEDDTPEAKRKALEKAKSLKERIDAGDEFGQLAIDNSMGPSAPNKGFLGTFRRGELDPAFETAAWSLQVGETSDVTETKFGFHIINVVGEELKANPDIDQRRDMIRAEMQQTEMNRLLKQYISQLRTRAFVEVLY